MNLSLSSLWPASLFNVALVWRLLTFLMSSIACHSGCTLTEPLLHFDSFIFQTFCCWFASSWFCSTTQFQPSFSFWTRWPLISPKNTLMDFKCRLSQWLQGNWVLWLQKIPTSSCLNPYLRQLALVVCAYMLCFGVCLGFFFLPNVVLCIMSKLCHFVLICQTTFPELVIHC